MTNGEKNKDISDISTWGEKCDKGKGSIKIKILSTQVGGASS